MIENLSIWSDDFEVSISNEGFYKSEFTTSADVVMEASGLRLEAIRVIAREQGVEIEAPACRCIDENLLAAFADAHVRKMRAYFNNAHRHISELDGDELTTFVDFCKTFKKRQITHSTAESWNDIDTDAIREQFIQKVHQLTRSSFLHFRVDATKLFDQMDESISLELRHLDTREFLQRDSVIKRVLCSHLHYERPQKKPSNSLDYRLIVRRVTLSARYHIFTSEEDNHPQDASLINSIVNSAPAMVA